MNIVFMSMDTPPSTLWARDLYDQMHIRSDFRKWFPRMCQYGFIEGRDYEYMPRVRLRSKGVQSAAALARHPVPSQRSVGTVFGTPRQMLYVQPDVPAPAQRWFRSGKAAHCMDAERSEVPLPHFKAARGAAAG